MAEPLYLCAACLEEIAIAAGEGRCPGCGLRAPLEEIEAEVEAALAGEALRRLNRLDPEARAAEAPASSDARFVLRP